MKKPLIKGCKPRTRSKGNVLVITLVIVNFVILLSLYIVTKVDNLVFYNENLERYTLKEDLGEKLKEYALSKLNDIFIQNIDKICTETVDGTDGIDEFFKSYNDNSIVAFENCIIKYNSNDKEFLIETTVQDGSSYKSVLEDKFYIEISEGKPKFIFLK